MKKKTIFNLIIIIGLFIITGCINNKYDVLKGKWIATIKNQKVYQTDDNETIGGKEDYYLKCNGKGYYDLTAKSGDLANASYTIINNTVTFYDEGKEVLAICKINKDKLNCSKKSYYAVKYIKVKK